MNLDLAELGALAAALAAGTLYGVLLYKFRLFPFEPVRWLYKRIVPGGTPPRYGPWTIAIVEGDDPFRMVAQATATTPIVRAQDVTDLDARYVADPFLYRVGDTQYVFFEVVCRDNEQGDIAYASCRDGDRWRYGRRIIDEPFHLSYPQVFEWEGHHYLVPESNEDLSVRLYRAESFPDRWAHVGTLMSGFRFVDPTLFRHQGLWWMFVTTPENAALNLFFSDHLTRGWTPHPLNPLIRHDPHTARPAGRVATVDGRLIRFAQDDEPSYGIQVFAFEIVTLSTTQYVERPILDGAAVAAPSGQGWNAAGMHHMDLHRVGDRWIAAVDGRAW
jgi:hypothetical protein